MWSFDVQMLCEICEEKFAIETSDEVNSHNTRAVEKGQFESDQS